MKGYKEGSSLVEFMIYITLFAWIAQIAFEWSTSLLLKQVVLDQRCSELVSLSLIYDLLHKDFISAYSEATNWKFFSPTHVLFVTSTTTVEWRLDSVGIVRTEGLYNSTTGRWSETKKTHLGPDGALFEYSVEKKGDIIRSISFWVGNLNNRIIGMASPAGIFYL